jgi:hypothetical protein
MLSLEKPEINLAVSIAVENESPRVAALSYVVSYFKSDDPGEPCHVCLSNLPRNSALQHARS